MHRHLLLIITLMFLGFSWSQDKATFSGTIKDAATGEELIGATVKLKDQAIGTATNEYGFFSITLPVGQYTFVITSIDFDFSRTPTLSPGRTVYDAIFTTAPFTVM